MFWLPPQNDKTTRDVQLRDVEIIGRPPCEALGLIASLLQKKQPALPRAFCYYQPR
jgi:hypothetical protein